MTLLPLGASPANRWLVSDTEADLVRRPPAPLVVELAAAPQALRIDLRRTAFLVIDMQNDFCAPGGWLHHIGVDVAPLQRPIAPLQLLLPKLRARGARVVWVNWGNRPDRLNLSPALRRRRPHRQASPDTLSRLGSRPVQFSGTRHAALTVSVGHDHAGVDGEGFGANQPFGHAAREHGLEHLTQKITVAEPAVTVLEEGRVVGQVAVETQTAEPEIGAVEVDLATQPPLEADPQAVTNQQHPDHQLWIIRRPPLVDLAQHVITWDMPLQAEAIEQRLLHHHPFAHQRPNLRSPGEMDQDPNRASSREFFNAIARKQSHFRPQ